MKKPKLLDLFCGAGGASMGYYRAGFEVEGVDIKPQPRYPFKFYLSDALEFSLEGYDAYHASPPCQKFSILNNRLPHLKRTSGQWVDLIEPIRKRLLVTGKPYIVENVVGARAELINPIMLCGVMFNLEVLRHRLFECNFVIFNPPHIKHKGTVNDGDYMTVSSMGGGWLRSDGTKRKGSRKTKDWCRGMGINWMDRYGLTQAIPPAYTEYIGKYLINSHRIII